MIIVKIYLKGTIILLGNKINEIITFPNGERIWFGKKRRKQWMPVSSESASNLKKIMYGQQSGRISHIVRFSMILNIKVLLLRYRLNRCMQRFKILKEQLVNLKLALIRFWQKTEFFKIKIKIKTL